MYLQALNIATYFLTTLFLIVLLRAIYNGRMKKLWLYVQQQAKIKLRIKNQIEKSKARGEKEFFFRNGTVRIFAKTSARALHKFRQFEKNEEAQKQQSIQMPKRAIKRQLAQSKKKNAS